MPLNLREIYDGKVLVVNMSGKLKASDYDAFEPAVERLIAQHGKINAVVEMHDFDGWGVGALWEDIKFDVKHCRDFERIAMIGDEKWQEGMATFCKPFTSAKVKYFSHAEAQDAIAWASEGLTQTSKVEVT
jgi:hypothetical protein